MFIANEKHNEIGRDSFIHISLRLNTPPWSCGQAAFEATTGPGRWAEVAASPQAHGRASRRQAASKAVTGPGRWAEVAASLQTHGRAGRRHRQPRRAGGREEAENLKPFFP